MVLSESLSSRQRFFFLIEKNLKEVFNKKNLLKNKIKLIFLIKKYNNPKDFFFGYMWFFLGFG